MHPIYKGGIKEGVTFTLPHSSGRIIGELDGKKIYTELAIPGETGSLILDRKKRGFYAGILLNLNSISPYRVKPFCKHFKICGGCNWQHIDYSYQLQLKTTILSNALIKYNIPFVEVNPVIPCDKIHYYRNKTEYMFAQCGLTINSDNEPCEIDDCIGFHPTDRKDIIIHSEECYIQRNASDYSKLIFEIAKNENITFYNYENRSGLIRNLIIRSDSTSKTLLIVGFNENKRDEIHLFLQKLANSLPQDTSLLFQIIPIEKRNYSECEIFTYNKTSKKPFLTERVNGLEFKYGPKCFYQPNPDQAGKMFGLVTEFAELKGNEFIFDLYTGVGTIALHLARYAKKVIGIENSKESIDYARENAQLNNITNCEFINGDTLETFTKDFIDNYNQPDIIVLDPPRSGTLIEIKKTILYANPLKIIYVSCNPVSLAYDLTMLIPNYVIKKIQPLDMFPHTHHLETIVLLERKN